MGPVPYWSKWNSPPGSKPTTFIKRPFGSWWIGGRFRCSERVADQYCRVHGVEGLRVADTSVMPDVVRANTNTTAMAIGERVADWMKPQGS